MSKFSKSNNSNEDSNIRLHEVQHADTVNLIKERINNITCCIKKKESLGDASTTSSVKSVNPNNSNANQIYKNSKLHNNQHLNMQNLIPQSNFKQLDDAIRILRYKMLIEYNSKDINNNNINDKGCVKNDNKYDNKFDNNVNKKIENEIDKKIESKIENKIENRNENKIENKDIYDLSYILDDNSKFNSEKSKKLSFSLNLSLKNKLNVCFTNKIKIKKNINNNQNNQNDYPLNKEINENNLLKKDKFVSLNNCLIPIQEQQKIEETCKIYYILNISNERIKFITFNIYFNAIFAIYSNI